MTARPSPRMAWRPAHLPLALAALGVFLPWVTSPAGSLLGLGEVDGFLVLLLSGSAIIVTSFRLRWGWTLAGLAAAIAIRDIARVQDAEGVSVAIGLWITAAGLVVGTVWLLAEMFMEARTQRRARDEEG